MISASRIEYADEAEEAAAADALRATKTLAELQSVWWRDAGAFDGAARERLQIVYAAQLRSLGVLAP